MPNAGIFLSYFNVGIAIYILQAPLSYYLIDTLDISSTNYNAFFTLVSLPWSLKFILGSLSDGIPILGYRRKSWLLIGWVLYIIAAMSLALFEKPSFIATSAFSFIMTCSYILADVCNDALCVERARHEQEEIKGAIQTAGYTIRSVLSTCNFTFYRMSTRFSSRKCIWVHHWSVIGNDALQYSVVGLGPHNSAAAGSQRPNPAHQHDSLFLEPAGDCEQEPYYSNFR